MAYVVSLNRCNQTIWSKIPARNTIRRVSQSSERQQNIPLATDVVKVGLRTRLARRHQSVQAATLLSTQQTPPANRICRAGRFLRLHLAKPPRKTLISTRHMTCVQASAHRPSQRIELQLSAILERVDVSTSESRACLRT